MIKDRSRKMAIHNKKEPDLELLRYDNLGVREFVLTIYCPSTDSIEKRHIFANRLGFVEAQSLLDNFSLDTMKAEFDKMTGSEKDFVKAFLDRFSKRVSEAENILMFTSEILTRTTKVDYSPMDWMKFFNLCIDAEEVAQFVLDINTYNFPSKEEEDVIKNSYRREVDGTTSITSFLPNLISRLFGRSLRSVNRSRTSSSTTSEQK